MIPEPSNISKYFNFLRKSHTYKYNVYNAFCSSLMPIPLFQFLLPPFNTFSSHFHIFIFWSTLNPFRATSMCMCVGPSHTLSCLVSQGLHWRKLTLLSQKPLIADNSSVRPGWAPLPSMWTFHADGLSVGLVRSRPLWVPMCSWPVVSGEYHFTEHMHYSATYSLWPSLPWWALSPERKGYVWYRCPLRTEHSAVSYSVNINCNWWLFGVHHPAPK